MSAMTWGFVLGMAVCSPFMISAYVLLGQREKLVELVRQADDRARRYWTQLEEVRDELDRLRGERATARKLEAFGVGAGSDTVLIPDLLP